MQIAEFLSYLSSHGMVDPAKLPDHTEEGYDNRMKAQVYAFLARSFGLDMGYVFNGYLNGAFSPDMEDYFDSMDVASLKPATSLPGLREGEFLSAVKGKSTDWLEVAASIIHTTSANPKLMRDDLRFVINFEVEFIDSVYRDLEFLGLIPIPQVS